MEWYELRSQLKISSEVRNHPHVPGENAQLFSSISFEGTEIEYLDLLYGLIRTWKPFRVLETGTRSGLSAAALGLAVKDNTQSGHSSHVDTLEISEVWANSAKSFLTECELSGIVTVHKGDSLDLIYHFNEEEPFDFVYFDSSRRTRLLEFETLNKRKLLKPSCLLVFHDTSPLRSQSILSEVKLQSEYLAGIRSIEAVSKQRFDFALSRGLTMFEL